MGRVLAAILMAFLLVGCSDDSTGEQDSALPDMSPDSALADAPGGDSAKGDSAKPDAAKADAAQPDSAVPDTLVAIDAGYPGCQKIFSLCGSSTTWKAYISPFTAAKCNTVVDCVKKLYTGTCLTTFQSLVTCMGTISSASQCDTKCATQFNYVYSSCACPKACGVPCL